MTFEEDWKKVITGFYIDNDGWLNKIEKLK